MEITASLVKELRERSGAGMMECKKALVESQGDIEAAMESLRKTGLAKADKKAGRVAAEGRIAVAKSAGERAAVLLEVNCETDFVAKDESFVAFADAVAQRALALGLTDVDSLKAAALSEGSDSIENGLKALVARIGENIQIRRAVSLAAADHLGVYLHGTRIGVLLSLKGGNVELARDLAMHVAAMRPGYLDMDQIPAEIANKEKEIALAQVADSGKPAEILEKMVQGKVRKTLSELTLLGQSFVKGDGKQTVEQVLKAAGAVVTGYERLEVGEGIEKKVEDFAAEVMKQVQGG